MKKIKTIFLLLIFLPSLGIGQSYIEEDDEYNHTIGQEEIDETKDFTVEVVDEYYNESENYEYFQTPAAQERDKTIYNQRESDPGFKNNYKGKRFDYEKPEKEYKPYNGPNLSLSFLFSKVVMYTVLALIILAVIYYIIKNSGGFSFGSDRQKINYASDAEQLFEDEENIKNNDFAGLIQKAKSENNYRLAIRYYFLWVLQSLSDKKLIDWNRDKTNFDYFKELGSNSIREDFFRNTHIYDYIWYGNFELGSNEFKTAESIFQKTLNKLK